MSDILQVYNFSISKFRTNKTVQISHHCNVFACTKVFGILCISPCKYKYMYKYININIFGCTDLPV